MHGDITFVKRYCKSLGNVSLVKTLIQKWEVSLVKTFKVGTSHSISLDEKYFEYNSMII